jgi:hypothetical protein
VHTGCYGTTTTSYGSYYHQPVTASYCYNRGSGGWGAPAAGVAVGVAAGVAVGAAATSTAYAAGVAAAPAAYAALPGGCAYQPVPREYQCGAMWLAPAYGAKRRVLHGVYYKIVPAP